MDEAIKIDVGSDSPEQIALCLSCSYPRCINCAKHSSLRRRKDTYNTPVFQYESKTMKLVRSWPSAAHAARDLGISAGALSSALSGRQKTAGGYVWRRSPVDTTTEEESDK